jgi:hypothetical protein
MAEPRADLSRRSQLASDWPTIIMFSVAAFLAVLAFLETQLLGQSQRRTAGVRPREVLVRRVYRTTVIERLLAPGAGGRTSQTSSQTVSGSPSTAAPAASAVAPVLTRTS